MMNRFYILALLLFTGGLLQAQDKFYLKNGSIIKGRYIHKLSTDSTIYVVLEGGEIVIPQPSVAYAKFKRHYGMDEDESKEKGIKPKITAPGFYTVLNMGGNIGSHSTYYSTVTPFIESIMGYRWDRLKNVGAGISLDVYEMYLAVPVYVHYEYDIGYQNFHPFVFGNTGYGHVWKKTAPSEGLTLRGGLYLSAGFGYKINTRKGDIRLSLGFKSQQANMKTEGSNPPPNLSQM